MWIEYGDYLIDPVDGVPAGFTDEKGEGHLMTNTHET